MEIVRRRCSCCRDWYERAEPAPKSSISGNRCGFCRNHCNPKIQWYTDCKKKAPAPLNASAEKNP